MKRKDRKADEMRPVSIERGIQPKAAGSVLIKMGGTHVICGVSVEEGVPPFLQDKSQGWITAEYGLLPCATHTRYRRETKGPSGRTLEIQRLVGRSLRMMVDLKTIGERTLRVDCDVLNADGGTRTASITGAAIALADTLRGLVANGDLSQLPRITPIAAVSVGILGGEPYLDLDYLEDSSAEMDANFVMADDGRWVEIQATAEGSCASDSEIQSMLLLAGKGCRELLALWK
ncbi:MAG: ribonuclease PH [Deltaproteobacteria bacterium]|nr:MAG: ribonuclease PH [Deltaproteobacteria bacterium]